MPTILSEPCLRLLKELREVEERTEEEVGERIHVSQITRGLGFLYERIRNILDYKEESLWAKNAIFRFLLSYEFQFLEGANIGLSLIQELIRGRYLENDLIPESKAIEIDAILKKYRAVWLITFSEGVTKNKQERLLAEWLLGIAASEIEEVLRKNIKDYLYFRFLYEALLDRVEFPPEINQEAAKLQLYLASFRAFFQADSDMEAWMLWKISFPEWKDNLSEELIKEIGENLPKIKERFDSILSWPLRSKLDNLMKRRSVLVTLLSDILQDHLTQAEELLTDAEKLEANLRLVYERRYQENRQRLRRTAFRAVIFILITKIFFALFIERAYELWTVGSVDKYALSLNILLPPTILMIASLSIRMPGEESNFAKLLVEFNRLLSPDNEALGILRPPKTRSLFANFWLGVLYILNSALTFGILFWFVRTLRFNILSAIIFIFFLSIVSFFALRLRKTANELAAVEETEHWLRQIFDFLIFPIVEVGRFLSWGFRSLNLAVILFDFLLEAPFRAFISILEEWVSFLRERRESL